MTVPRSRALARLIDTPPPFRGTAAWHKAYVEAVAELAAESESSR